MLLIIYSIFITSFCDYNTNQSSIDCSFDYISGKNLWRKRLNILFFLLPTPLYFIIIEHQIYFYIFVSKPAMLWYMDFSGRSMVWSLISLITLYMLGPIHLNYNATCLGSSSVIFVNASVSFNDPFKNTAVYNPWMGSLYTSFTRFVKSRLFVLYYAPSTLNFSNYNILMFWGLTGITSIDGNTELLK